MNAVYGVFVKYYFQPHRVAYVNGVKGMLAPVICSTRLKASAELLTKLSATTTEWPALMSSMAGANVTGPVKSMFIVILYRIYD